MSSFLSPTSPFLAVFASIALLMYGLMAVSTSLEKLLASQITRLINRLSQGSFFSMVFGLSLTSILQSSGTVTSLLVSLGSARVITLRQVMGVILGTAVGSTVTVQIMSFHSAQFGLPFFCCGFFGFFFSKSQLFRTIYSIFMGFGLVFLGLESLTHALTFASENSTFSELLSTLQASPLFSFGSCLLICAVIHSSAVTIGLLIALAQVHLISVDQAFYGVLGANVGTTFTAIFASLRANNIAKQVAFAHFFFKSMSVCLFLIPYVHQGLLNCLKIGDFASQHEIANTHTLISLVSAILFYPFIDQGAAFIERIFKSKGATSSGPQFLKLNTYHSQALALSYVQKEISRMSEIVLSLLHDSLRLFEKMDAALIDSIKARNSQVDLIFTETKNFLLEQVQKSSVIVHQEIMFLILFISDLEKVAESVDVNILNLALKKDALRVQFSSEGWREICLTHSHLCELFKVSLRSFHDRALCQKTIELKRAFSKLEVSMKEHHIERLHRGLHESIVTSAIHLDTLSEFKRLASLICSHAYLVRGQKESVNEPAS